QRFVVRFGFVYPPPRASNNSLVYQAYVKVLAVFFPSYSLIIKSLDQIGVLSQCENIGLSWFRGIQSCGISIAFLKPFVIASSIAYNLALSSSDNSFLTVLAQSVNMNQAQALKNLVENGTSIEYFNNGYIMQVKDKIKVYEEGKKTARTLTQAQQTKLLLEARGGGQTKPKRTTKRYVENDFDDDADDEFTRERLASEDIIGNFL
ncbi:MAG: hypothetical protein EZS28_042728, partial [Streblomastix strix]